METKFSKLMEAKSYSIQFLIFEMLISHWWRLRFLLVVNPCDHTVNTFPKNFKLHGDLIIAINYVFKIM